jgi:hypothetical protein
MILAINVGSVIFIPSTQNGYFYNDNKGYIAKDSINHHRVENNVGHSAFEKN